MSFTYTQNVPNPPNLPSADVGNMQTNTNSIFSIWNVDHETFGSAGSIDGRHKQVSLINEAAPGVPANIGGVLFANNPAPTNISWPFWQNASGTTQLISGIPSAANPGYSFLPGGLIIQWGTKTPLVNQTLTAVTFPIAFPNNCFVVLVTEKRTASPNNVDQLYVNAKSTTTFSYYATTTGTGFASFDWIAIGN
jgi:hypothetical protein